MTSWAARGLFARSIFEEERDRDIQNIGDVLKAAGADTVRALFVFLDLLEADADVNRQLLLRQAEQTAPTAQTLAQVKIDVGRHWPRIP